MAYIKLIEKACDIQGCKKRASISLYNKTNAHFGDYCRSHGDRKLREMKAAEEKGEVWE